MEKAAPCDITSASVKLSPGSTADAGALNQTVHFSHIGKLVASSK
jgi:hypothetical protein